MSHKPKAVAQQDYLVSRIRECEFRLMAAEAQIARVSEAMEFLYGNMNALGEVLKRIDPAAEPPANPENPDEPVVKLVEVSDEPS